MNEFPWEYYVTKPLLIRAIVVSADNFVGDGIEVGDFLIENPDPLERADAPFIHCPRQEFLAHYEVADVESQESRADGQESSQGCEE